MYYFEIMINFPMKMKRPKTSLIMYESESGQHFSNIKILFRLYNTRFMINFQMKWKRPKTSFERKRSAHNAHTCIQITESESGEKMPQGGGGGKSTEAVIEAAAHSYSRVRDILLETSIASFFLSFFWQKMFASFAKIYQSFVMQKISLLGNL